MPRRFINEHKLKDFAGKRYDPKNPLKMPRLAYAVKKDGGVVWIGRNHREIEGEHVAEVKHWGYFMDAGGMIGHSPRSTSESRRKVDPVPPELMGELEAELKKHRKDTPIERGDF